MGAISEAQVGGFDHGRQRLGQIYIRNPRFAGAGVTYFGAMNFRQRLFRFGIGIFIGTVLAYLFFQGRSCSDWLPDRRIRASLESGGLVWGNQAECVWNCLSARETLAEPVASLVYEGEIDWGKSGPRETPRRYVFRYESGPVQEATFLLTEDQSFLDRLELASGQPGCDCPHTEP